MGQVAILDVIWLTDAAGGDSGAPLLLIERVLPEKVGPEDLDGPLTDLDMLVNPGGQERTGTIPTPTSFQIVESLPA